MTSMLKLAAARHQNHPKVSRCVRSLKRARGFTLIEMLVTIALTVLVMGALSMLIVYFYRTNSYTLGQSIASEQARRGVEDAMRHLREASYGSDGSYPIGSASTSTIVFYANVTTAPEIGRITYELVGGTLYRGVAEPSGNPPSYVGATYATSTIATSIVNGTSTPIFTYYDASGAVLSSPINVSKISSVRTTLQIDVNVNRAPTTYTLYAGATLRNLKAQL